MGEAFQIFVRLLGPKVRAVLRASEGGRRQLLRWIFFGALGLLFAVGIYAGTAWFLRQCLAVELVGPLIPGKLMSMVLLVLMSVLLISTTISSFSVFFLSDDLVLLFSAPVPVGPLYFARFVEMVLHSSWMVLFFGLPVFLAYGKVYQAQADFYLVLALLFPGLILIPGALGAIIAAVLTRLFSARRSRDLLVVLVLVAFVILYLMIRALRPEKLLSEESFGSMVEFLSLFQSPEARFLPTAWMSEALMPLLEHRAAGVLPGAAIWATALGLVALSGWVGAALYRTGFARAQEGRIRWLGSPQRAASRSRVLGRWLDRLGGLVPGLTGAILVKDVRVFLRDTNQWLQLLLLGALSAVYLLNFFYLRLANNFNWFTLFTVNHVLMGLVLSGIAVRFVFPAVSLEGRAFWLMRAAPVRLADFLHSKLMIYFAPLAALGVGLSVISCWVIGVPPLFTLISIVLVGMMTLAVCAMGVGIGAMYPRFTVENPAKIPTGVGGVAFMITSMGFVIVFLLASFYPTFVLFHLPGRPTPPPIQPRWLWLSLVTGLTLFVAACWIPMAWGRRVLSRSEE